MACENVNWIHLAQDWVQWTVPYLRRVVQEGILPRRPEFNSRSFDSEFVVDGVVLGQVFSAKATFFSCIHSGLTQQIIYGRSTKGLSNHTARKKDDPVTSFCEHGSEPSCLKGRALFGQLSDCQLPEKGCTARRQM
jgi:hypothetical protein